MSRFVNLEFGHEHEGDFDQSRAVKDERYYAEQARVAFEHADFEKALRHYSRVLEFNPQNVTAWTGQVQALIELGEFREAKLWSDKALEHFPNDPELLAAKAVALARNGDLDAAMAFSDASIEERGGSPYIWLARGDVLLARAEKRAGYCFDKAQALAPGDWFITWLIARVRYFYEQFTLALKMAQEAVSRNSAHGPLWLLIGLCQKKLGLIGPARESIRQALELDPDCRAARQALGELAGSGAWSHLAGWWRGLFHRSL